MNRRPVLNNEVMRLVMRILRSVPRIISLKGMTSYAQFAYNLRLFVYSLRNFKFKPRLKYNSFLAFTTSYFRCVFIFGTVQGESLNMDWRNYLPKNLLSQLKNYLFMIM